MIAADEKSGAREVRPGFEKPALRFGKLIRGYDIQTQSKPAGLDE